MHTPYHVLLSYQDYETKKYLDQSKKNMRSNVFESYLVVICVVGIVHFDVFVTMITNYKKYRSTQ